MQAICGQIGLALGRAELFSQLSALAFEDALTKLANRRSIEERLEGLAARREPTALLLGDLDGLKGVNDRLGHEAGDAVLSAAADALRAATDVVDGTPGRLGGDEFCVVLPGAAPAEAEAFARAASDALRARTTDVTFSWGIAVTADLDWRPAALLRAADGAQYQAKRGGGDCVRTAAAPVTGLREPARGHRTRDQAPRVAGLMEEALAWLDGDGRAAPVAQRMQGVAELAAAALGAANWAVSIAVRRPAAHARADRPPARARRPRASARPTRGRWPTTPPRATCSGAAAASTCAATTPTADAAERALLVGIGKTQLLAAAAAGHLVELHGDAATPPMDWALSPFRLLVREALSGPGFACQASALVPRRSPSATLRWLRGRPDQELVDVDVRRLLHGEEHGAGDVLGLERTRSGAARRRTACRPGRARSA